MEKDIIYSMPEYDKFTTVDEFIKSCEILISNGNTFEAIECMKKAEEKLIEGQISLINKPKNSKFSDYELFQANPIIKICKEEDDLYFICMDHFKKINKRDPDSSYDGIDNWFIQEDKLESLTICGKVTLKTSFLRLVALFKELDLLVKNIDNYEEITLLKEASLTRWYTHAKIKMPLTIQNRDMILLGSGLFNKKEKILMILMKSPSKFEYPEIPNELKTHLRISMNFGFYFCKYIDNKTTELFTCFNINPKVQSIPWLIINNFIKNFGYYTLKDIRKTVENEENQKEYVKRIIAEPKFYNVARRELDLNDDEV